MLEGKFYRRKFAGDKQQENPKSLKGQITPLVRLEPPTVVSQRYPVMFLKLKLITSSINN